MKIIVLLFLFTHTCLTFDLPRGACRNDLTIDKNHYNVTKTYDMGEAEPTDTHYDSYGNLFFVLTGRDFDGYYFDIKIIKPNSTTAQSIPGLPERESYSIAVDKKEGKVYFGTGKGIFVYNYGTQDATLVSNPDVKLNALLVDKNGNKYITDRSDDFEQMYQLVGDNKVRFKGLDALDEVAVDDKNNFYYIRKEKFFVLKSNLSRAIFISNVSYDGLAQIAFYEENVYVASATLSYIHENDTGPLKLAKNIPGKVTAIAFDATGRFVLGTKGKILKYETNNKECYRRNN